MHLYKPIFNLLLLLTMCCPCRILAQQAVEFMPNVYVAQTQEGKVLPLANGFVSAHTILADTIDYGNTSYDIGLFYVDTTGTLIRQVTLMFKNGNQERFKDMIQTPDSGLLVLGIASGVVPGGIYSGALYKVDKQGQVQWKKAYGGENGFVPSTVSYDQYTQTYLVSGLLERKDTGRFYGRPFVFRVDTVGNLITEKDIILNNDTVSDSKALFTIALNDGTLLTAINSDPMGQSEVYFVKLSQTLDTIWCKNPFVDSYQRASIEYKYLFNKETLTTTSIIWVKNTLEENSIPYITNFDTSIRYRFIKNLTGLIGNSSSMSICPTQDEGLIIGTPFLKLNSEYEVEWQKTFPETIQIKDIIQLPNGSYALSGFKSFVAPNGTDFFWRPYMQLTNTKGWMVGVTEQTKPNSSTVYIYPNPANHTVSIAGGQGAQVSITSITGQQVWSSQLTNNTFSVWHLPEGLYLVTVQLLNGNQSTHKLVVQH